jgi:hypothetical protein
MRDNKRSHTAGRIFLALGLAGGILGGRALWQRLASAGRPFVPLERNGRPGTALITGGSSGIGAAFARQLAAKGYDLILVARREERLSAAAAKLGARYGIRAEALPADLADSAGIERVERRIGELEDLDILVNNAGFGVSGDFAEIEASGHVDMICVHVIASVRLSRAALPGMMARRRGAIINVSSLAAFAPVPGSTTYSATKAYLNVFSEALQVELSGTGVQVQALCPGFTWSEFHDRPELDRFDRSYIPGPLWMSSEQVAAESLAALKSSQVVYIPGLKNRALRVVARNVPLGLLRLWRRLVTAPR